MGDAMGDRRKNQFTSIIPMCQKHPKNSQGSSEQRLKSKADAADIIYCDKYFILNASCESSIRAI